MNGTISSGLRIVLIATLFAIVLLTVLAALPSSASADELPGSTTLTQSVSFRFKFWKRFIGQHDVYLMAEDAAGNSTGWQLMGSLEVR